MADFNPDNQRANYHDGRYSLTGQGIVAPMRVRHPSADVSVVPPAVDFETSVLCVPVTNVPILIVSTFSPTGVPFSIGYNVDGTVYVGNMSLLISCAGQAIESDPITMCDNGTTEFYRWIVTEDGEPTGVSFNTTQTGAPYVPLGAVTAGACGCIAAAAGVQTATKTQAKI